MVDVDQAAVSLRLVVLDVILTSPLVALSYAQ